MTTTLRNVMLVNLLAGCQLGNTLGDPLDQTGGGDGTPGLGMPDGCVEDHREVVADPAVAPEGFEESALDVIEGLTGSFGADVAMEDGSVLPVALSVAWDGGEVQAVYRRWSTNDQVEGPPMGAPATEDSGIEDEDACGPVYAFGVTTSLSALPLVGADGAGEVMFQMAGQPFVVAPTPLDQVEGTALPTFDPADWDRTQLSTIVDLHGDDVFLQLLWEGLNDQVPQAPTSTGTGTVTSTVSEPDGVSEWFLSAELARVE